MPSHASGLPLPDWVEWDPCDQVHDDGTPCTGAAQADYKCCLAHLLAHLNPTQLVEVMAPRPDEAPPNLDARGARLTADDLERVLAAARRRDGDLVHLPPINLSHAVVTGVVPLDGATVEGDVNLFGATVEGDVFLHGATVEGDVSLWEATVEGEASFGPMSLNGDLSLAGAEFSRPASLDVIAMRIDLSEVRCGRMGSMQRHSRFSQTSRRSAGPGSTPARRAVQAGQHTSARVVVAAVSTSNSTSAPTAPADTITNSDRPSNTAPVMPLPFPSIRDLLDLRFVVTDREGPGSLSARGRPACRYRPIHASGRRAS